MKTIIFILVLTLVTFLENVNAQEETEEVSSGFELSVDASMMLWNNSGISDDYGATQFIGAGIGTKISEDFKLVLELDHGFDEVEDLDLDVTKIEGGVKYAWRDFNYEVPTVYGGLGIVGLWVKQKVGENDEDPFEGNSVGFSAVLGVIIPLNGKANLDLKWNSIWSQMEMSEGDNEDVGSQVFSAGIFWSF